MNGLSQTHPAPRRCRCGHLERDVEMMLKEEFKYSPFLLMIPRSSSRLIAPRGRRKPFLNLNTNQSCSGPVAHIKCQIQLDIYIFCKQPLAWLKMGGILPPPPLFQSKKLLSLIVAYVDAPGLCVSSGILLAVTAETWKKSIMSSSNV